MISIKIPSYRPAEISFISLESNDILTTSNVEPGAGSGPADDPNVDKDW